MAKPEENTRPFTDAAMPPETFEMFRILSAALRCERVS